MPLFDPADYYDRQYRRLTNPWGDNRGAANRPAAYAPLSDQEEESALGAVARQGLGGLAYVGQSLDKALGGRAVRGVLGGKPEELLSLIPFSDALGITRQDDAVSGRDLLEKAGVLGANTEGLDVGDVAGFAADVALDPSTYLTFGGSAVGKAGKLAEAAGIAAKGMRGRATTTLADAIAKAGGTAMDDVLKAAKAQGVNYADVAGDTLGGLARARIPFTDVGVNLGTGKTAEAILDTAGSAASWLGQKSGANWLSDKLGLPGIGRGARALFDARAQNTTGEFVQPAMIGMAEPLAKLKADRKLVLGQAMQRMQAAGEWTPDAWNNLIDVMENVPVKVPLGPETQKVAAELRPLLDDWQKADAALGSPTGHVEYYFPRGQTPTAGRLAGSGGSSAFDPSGASREWELYGDLPRRELNRFHQKQFTLQPGQTLEGMTPLDRAHLVREQMLYPWEADRTGLGRQSHVQGLSAAAMEGRKVDLQQHLDGMRQLERDLKAGEIEPALVPQMEQQLAQMKRQWSGHMDPNLGWQPGLDKQLDRLLDIQKQSERMSDYLLKMDPVHAQQQLPFFGNNPFTDLGRAADRSATSQMKLNVLHDVVARTATNSPAGHDYVPVRDLFASLGLTEQAGVEAGKRLRAAGHGFDYLDATVPKAVADDLTRGIRGFSRPEALSPLLDAFDTVTNLTKFGQIGPWPARYVRDLGSQTWEGIAAGHANPLDFVKGEFDAAKVFRHGEVLDGAASLPIFAGKNLTDAQATKELQALAYAHGVAGPRKLTGVSDLNVPGSTHASEMAMRAPGQAQQTVPEILSSAVPRTRGQANPLSVDFAPARAAHELSGTVDDVARGSSFLELLKKGYTAEAAAKEANRVHYDFSNLSDFERSVMRRVFPYYSWSRANLPGQLSKIARQPGGMTGQALQGLAEAKQNEGFVPNDIAEGVGLKVGEPKEGVDRFISNLGLPFEDLKDYTAGRGITGSIARTLEKLAGQSNPLLKGPAELATGKQFHSGRNLSDLYSATGNTLADQILMNSPLSRLYTTGRQFVDPRKSFTTSLSNLVGPAKLTDVDMEKRKDVAARAAVADLLRGQPGVMSFETPYVPAANADQLSPDTLLLLRLNRTLERRAQERAREAKKEGR